MTISQIIELNNIAAACIDNNRLNDALNCLKRALCLSKSELSSSADASAISSKNQISSISHASQNLAPDEDAFKTCTNSFKYQIPILIRLVRSCNEYSDILSDPSKLRFFGGMAQILIFNMALVYDLRASSIQNDVSRKEKFRSKAKALYQHTLHLYEVVKDDRCSITEEETRCGGADLAGLQDLAATAAANNLVCMSGEGTDDSNEKWGWCQVLMRLSQELRSADYQGNNSLFRRVEFQARIFVTNAFFYELLSGSVSGAPAA